MMGQECERGGGVVNQKEVVLWGLKDGEGR